MRIQLDGSMLQVVGVGPWSHMDLQEGGREAGAGAREAVLLRRAPNERNRNETWLVDNPCISYRDFFTAGAVRCFFFARVGGFFQRGIYFC